MTDELFDARNALTVGNYDQAIADASLAKTNLRKADEIAAFNVDKEAVMARAQIGLGQYDGVVAQLRAATHPLLRSVSAYAELKAALRSNPVPPRVSSLDEVAVPAAVQASLDKLVKAADEHPLDPQHTSVAILACLGHLNVGQHKETVKLAWTWIRGLPEPQSAVAIRQSLELHSLACEALLRLNRSDQAAKEVREMEKIDDEAVTTLMYTGMVALYKAHMESDSRENYTLAVNAFKDAAMRSGNSVMLLNLQALGYMGLRQFDMAEKCLLDALAIRSGDADTVANLASVSAHIGKTAEQIDHYVMQAATAKGAWAQSYASAHDAFNAAAAALTPAQQCKH